MRHAAIQATVPTAPTCPEDEIARLGDGIYKAHPQQVEMEHQGEIVSIDVEGRQLGCRRRYSRSGGPPEGTASRGH